HRPRGRRRRRGDGARRRQGVPRAPPPRHAARAGVLPPRRHPPVRAAASARRVTADQGWGRVADAILASPVARAAYDGNEPPELAPLLDMVRHHAYRIGDADIEGLDPDVVLEATLGASLAVALAERSRAQEALR